MTAVVVGVLSSNVFNTSRRTFSFCLKKKTLTGCLMKTHRNISCSCFTSSSSVKKSPVEQAVRQCDHHSPRKLWTHSQSNRENDQHVELEPESYTHFGYDKVLETEKVERGIIKMTEIYYYVDQFFYNDIYYAYVYA